MLAVCISEFQTALPFPSLDTADMAEATSYNFCLVNPLLNVECNCEIMVTYTKFVGVCLFF